MTGRLAYPTGGDRHRYRSASRILPAALLVGLLLTAALAYPSAGLAQGPSNPLVPGLPQPSVSVPTTTTSTPTVAQTTTTAGGASGLSGSNTILIAVGALIVLGGISFFIWRDARRRAPVRHRAAAAIAGEGTRSGSKARAKPRKLSPAERRRRKRGRAR